MDSSASASRLEKGDVLLKFVKYRNIIATLLPPPPFQIFVDCCRSRSCHCCCRRRHFFCCSNDLIVVCARDLRCCRHHCFSCHRCRRHCRCCHCWRCCHLRHRRRCRRCCHCRYHYRHRRHRWPMGPLLLLLSSLSAIVIVIVVVVTAITVIVADATFLCHRCCCRSRHPLSSSLLPSPSPSPPSLFQLWVDCCPRASATTSSGLAISVHGARIRCCFQVERSVLSTKHGNELKTWT